MLFDFIWQQHLVSLFPNFHAGRHPAGYKIGQPRQCESSAQKNNLEELFAELERSRSLELERLHVDTNHISPRFSNLYEVATFTQPTNPIAHVGGKHGQIQLNFGSIAIGECEKQPQSNIAGNQGSKKNLT